MKEEMTNLRNYIRVLRNRINEEKKKNSKNNSPNQKETFTDEFVDVDFHLFSGKN